MKVYKLLVIFVCILCTSCNMNNPKESSSTTQNTNVTTKEDTAYFAKNEKYALYLPDTEKLAQEIQEFIYWEKNTAIERDEKEQCTIFRTLKEEKCLDKEIQMHFYMRECDVSEMDEGVHNFYNIIVTFPQLENLSFYSFEYNARGLSSDYDYGYGAWFDEDIDMDISAAKLEKEKWFQKQYSLVGETKMTISSETSTQLCTLENRFKNGEKDKIIADIKKTIQKEYKDAKNLVVYVRDFLPGDEGLQGKVVDLNMTGKYDMPLYWIYSLIQYSDEKMENFDSVIWGTHYSTAYSGAGQPDYNPTVKELKKAARQERDAVDASKCIYACHIKNGNLYSLMDERKPFLRKLNCKCLKEEREEYNEKTD